MGTVISNYEFGKVNSGAPSTSYYDVDVEIDSESSSTKMGVLQFKLPTRESIELSNKAFISTVTIRFTLTNDGSDIEIYKIKDEFASKINFHEMSFYSYNQEGQDASNKKWNPANWQQGHLATSDTTITEGNKLDTEPGGSATETLTLSEEDLQECGWTFGSICTLAVYNSGTDNFVITQNDVVITLNHQLRKPDQASMTLAANRNGTTGDLTVSLPDDSTISGYYIDMDNSTGVSATGSPDFTAAAKNLVVNTSQFSGSFTEGTRLFARVFTVNADNTGTSATGGTELELFRPKIKTSTGALLYTDSALSSALGSANANLSIGQKVYLKIITDAVANTPTSNKFTKIRVNWDSGVSDTDNDYAVYEMSELTPVHNNGSNTVVSHVYSSAGAKVVKVQVEDQNGFRSDKQAVNSHQPDVKFGFPSAVISTSTKKVTQAKYGDRTTALTLSGQHSRSSGADTTIDQFLWGYIPESTSNTIVTANALENDNSVFDDGSKRVKIGSLSSQDVDDTTFKIFGLASYDSSGDSISDTAATFDHYAFTSATAAPASFDIDARPNIGSVAVDAGGDEIFFKEIECVVCVSKAAAENGGLYDCKRFILVANEADTGGAGNTVINKDLFYDSNVANAIEDSTSNLDETLTATDDVLTITGSVIVPGDIIKIDNEIMFVHSLSGSTIGVERGYNNTTATTHSSSTDINVYRFANRYKWGGHAMLRGTSPGFVDFDNSGKIVIQDLSASHRSGFHDCWFEQNFFTGDIIKVGNDSGDNGTFDSPKFYKLKSFLRDSDNNGVEDGNFYNVALIETDENNLTEEERTYISTSVATTDADETPTIIRHDSAKKPTISCAVYNTADAQDEIEFYLAVVDSSKTRYNATDRSSTSTDFNFQFYWSETNTSVVSTAPKTLNLDDLALASNIAIEKVNLTRSGGISTQMPLGIRRYPVGVTRTKLGVPKVTVQAKALDQTGYRALFSLVEGNRYDYVFLDSKKLDSPTTSYRTLRMRLESGNLTKDTIDPNVYLANLNFVIIGEDVS
tara:strand:- start:2234 stop:5320 length:3087 start_codon:yes stop_codon:yes gene_type:complete